MFTDTASDCIDRNAFTFGLRSAIQRVQHTIKAARPASQGGVISPCLSNIFLHYVLDEWFREQRGLGCILNF
jgi:hypothetical protein